jgi:hypothetical protein
MDGSASGALPTALKFVPKVKATKSSAAAPAKVYVYMHVKITRVDSAEGREALYNFIISQQRKVNRYFANY